MARRSSDESDGKPRRSVADLRAAAGMDTSAPRHRRALRENIESGSEPGGEDQSPQAEPSRADAEAAQPPVSAEADAARPPVTGEVAETVLTPPASGEAAEADPPAPKGSGEAAAAEQDESSSTPEAADAPPTLEPADPVTGEMAATQSTTPQTGAPPTLMVLEVVLAAVLGFALSYVYRLLWDLQAYLAAITAPLVLCGVVLIVGAARRRLGHGAIPLPLLLLILFVVTLLVMLPAAWVLDGR